MYNQGSRMLRRKESWLDRLQKYRTVLLIAVPAALLFVFLFLGPRYVARENALFPCVWKSACCRGVLCQRLWLHARGRIL